MKFKSNKREIMKAFSLLTQIGITMLVTIGIMFFVGKLLDDWLNTTPLFILIFSLLGVFGAFRNLYVMTKDFTKEKPKK